MTNIEKILVLNKEIGETPLERINRFKVDNPEYKDLPMTYAGRLDPMAEGVLLVLIGEECKKKEEYLYLDKEYEIEVLFGFETDTQDIFGKIIKNGKLSFLETQYILNVLKKVKDIPQKYPAYSSKTFEGKPLWQWAREGEEKQIESNGKIINIIFLGEREIKGEELLKNVEERISKVKGDFRQEEIVDLWKEKISLTENYKIISLKVISTGGAYMRVLALEIGKLIGVPSLAFSIKRKKVGNFSL